jgi:PAS domain S-box-containing protein
MHSRLRSRRRYPEAKPPQAPQGQGEERDRLIVEAAQEGIVIADRQGAILFSNARFAEMLGRSVDELVGESALSFISEESQPALLQEMRLPTALTKKQLDLKFRRRDGSDVWVLASGSPVYDKEGHWFASLGLLTDITERKRVEQALQVERQRILSILDTLPVQVYLQSADYSIRSANRSFKEQFGDPLGRRCYEVIMGLDRRCEVCQAAQVFRTQSPLEWEGPVAGGRVHHVYKYPFRDADSSDLVLSVSVDVTARKAAEEANALLAAIVESSENAIFAATLDGRISSWNSAAERLYGYSPEEAIGQSIFFIIPPDRWPERPEIVDRISAGERVEHFETMRLRKDGRQIPVSVTISPIRDSSGRVVGMSSISRDISERRRSEAERERLLEEIDSEQRFFQAVVDSAPVGIVVLRAPDYACEAFNSMAQVVSGNNLQLGKPYADIWPEARQSCLSIFDEVVRTGEPHYAPDVPIQIQPSNDPSPREAYFTLVTVPFVGREGRGDAVLRLAIETTEEVKTRQRIQELDRLKDEFITIAAHELRTPLTSLKGYTQTATRHLRHLEEAEAARKALGIINTQADRMTMLVTQLLDVSRIQAGKLEFQLRPIELVGLAAETVEQLQTSTERHHLSFKGEAPITVFADAERVQQVLFNLIHNAIKYSPRGGDIQVSLLQDGERALVAVADRGSGISFDDQARVFERFFRGTTPSQGAGGLGLGLYICKDIVGRLGGRIWVESVPEKGSTFYFTLPLAPR